MPIYEYQCGKCGNHLEVMQKMSDAPLTKCPKCKANKLAKLFSQSAFQFKGSGWYVTDYSAKGKAASTEAKPDKTDGKKEKTDSKKDKKETAAAAGA